MPNFNAIGPSVTEIQQAEHLWHPLRLHAPRATVGTNMIRHWSHARQKGWGYTPKKTACQSDLRFQRYKPLKSVTTAGRPAGRRAGGPLILRFLVYISRNSLRASRSLVIISVSKGNNVHQTSLKRFIKKIKKMSDTSEWCQTRQAEPRDPVERLRQIRRGRGDRGRPEAQPEESGSTAGSGRRAARIGMPFSRLDSR